MTIKKKKPHGARQMAQWVEALATSPGHLKLIPETQVKGEN